MATEIESPAQGNTSRKTQKTVVFLVVAAIVVITYTQLGDLLSLENLAKHETGLREFQADHPILVYGVAFFVYVVVTGLSLPGAAVLTLVYGWYFGLLRGVVLVSFASTAGATVAFLLSRFLFRDSIRKRFGQRLQSFNEALEREGPFFLFTMRLIPAVPFFVINAVMGLTPIRTLTFCWVSQLGMLAGTAVYVYAGSSVPDLQTLAEDGIGAVFSPIQLAQIIIAFAILGIFPLIVRLTMKCIKRPSSSKGVKAQRKPSDHE
ncbi:TVP38/TMEM64 family protein [Novipirellula artificiosorum]|uniref:TVP38/TMEM64 family membrane protein n=1 Tax=Novipirellula artificiosorum TaxID=2528016 RepID=A0A5C6DGZ5_9BACT|nr:TVP38/TMEM64 family protein [Novipirellula artificiosorum]TWU34279.1 TVP38/TMEM64 family inner membrane protein YdjZ [Novipirellula artificiosorum]